MRLTFNRKLHRELKHQAPEGYEEFVTRREGSLFTLIYCEDQNYFAPWAGLQSILESFGY